MDRTHSRLSRDKFGPSRCLSCTHRRRKYAPTATGRSLSVRGQYGPLGCSADNSRAASRAQIAGHELVGCDDALWSLAAGHVAESLVHAEVDAIEEHAG